MQKKIRESSREIAQGIELERKNHGRRNAFLHTQSGIGRSFSALVDAGEGIIGLQSETAEIYYRNMEIKEFEGPVPLDTFMATSIEDRFNRGYTYKYRSVGTLIYNRTVVVVNGANLWVPDGFPDNEKEEGQTYDNLKDSPVSWVLYSEGPRFDLDSMKELKYPVPKQTWYNPETHKGVIVRMRLKKGQQIGSFEGK